MSTAPAGTAPAATATVDTGPAGDGLAGTGTLVRFLLRRDRIRLPAWLAGLGLYVLYVGTALPTLAPGSEGLNALAPLFSQPVGRMFTGPAFGMDAPTYERLFASGYALYLFLLAALMSILLVTRHTRLEEQSGRAELIRADVTGRNSALTAALLVAAVANAGAVVVVSGMCLVTGFAAGGSVLVGLSTGLTGLAFAGIAAVTAQLSEFSRTAAGMAGIVLGAAFVLRALGDMAAVGGTALSWASPLGWAAQTAPYVHNRWAPLTLLVGLAVVTVTAAYLLLARRDFGAGVVAPRPGRPRAGRALGTTVGLAARLQRGALLAWGSAIVAMGVVDGAFARELLGAADDMPPGFREVFGTRGLLDGYVAFLGKFAAVMVAAYAVYAVQTLREEEARGRAELVLATGVGRVAWLASHTLVVATGVVLVSVACGLGTGLAAAAVLGEGGVVGDVLVAHLATIPAPLAVLGVSVALFARVPRIAAPVGWALVALTGVVTVFAELLDLPGWVRALSPLYHLADVPVEEFAPAPFLAVTAVAGFAVAMGLAGMRKRQIGG